ncbi:MAG TPA: ketol-acid reductoisomerase, partial [candidate division Zixibacteria bacterium]
YVSGKSVINKNEMKRILSRIKNGDFAKRWMKEYESGMKNYKKMKKSWENHLMQKTWEKLNRFLV